MLALTLLPALAALTTTALATPPHDFGWILPEHLAPSVYEWAFVPTRNGAEYLITQYDVDANLNMTEKRPDTTRPFGGSIITCNPINKFINETFNIGHGITAMERLSNWCERYKPQLGSLVASVEGGMSYYRCGYDLHYVIYTQQLCSRTEIFEAARLLDRECGYGMPGEVRLPSAKMAFGRGIHGTSICHNILDQPGLIG